MLIFIARFFTLFARGCHTPYKGLLYSPCRATHLFIGQSIAPLLGNFLARLRVCYALGRCARTRIMRVITCKVRNIIEITVHFRAFRQIWSKKVFFGGKKIYPRQYGNRWLKKSDLHNQGLNILINYLIFIVKLLDKRILAYYICTVIRGRYRLMQCVFY